MSYKDNETNVGKKWSKEEIDDLKVELNDKLSYSKIAEKHKRSERAIKLYGLNLANKLLESEYKNKHIDCILGFNISEIDEYNSFKENEKKRKKEKQKAKQDEKQKAKQDEKQNFNENNGTNYFKKHQELNYEQKQYYNKIIETEESVFLTGSPGTGKSFTLRKLIEYFKDNNYNIGITSTTGCSAILIGARTLHSFLKINVSKKGKFVFILLLLLVVVSFVLYLSQGSSVFDLMSDGGREKKEFYGYDWNDPDQRRFLNVTTRAAGAVGAWLSPTQDVYHKYSYLFCTNLHNIQNLYIFYL